MLETENLVYVYPDNSVGIHETSIALPTGSRTLLLGANGAGKSTLLRVLAGKTLAKKGRAVLFGRDPFRDGVTSTTYLGTEWAINPIVRHDIAVSVLISSVGGDLYPERRDQLIDILDIDISWHMHAVSDGERRRVQLCMGLLKPWTTLLLDEVTVDLDVLVRARLLAFLKNETTIRDCQIVYATHIFDGLAGWPTHLVHLHLGRVVSIEDYATSQELKGANSSLLELALKWLTEDLADRGARQARPQWSDTANDLTSAFDGDVNKYFKFSRGRE